MMLFLTTHELTLAPQITIFPKSNPLLNYR